MMKFMPFIVVSCVCQFTYYSVECQPCRLAVIPIDSIPYFFLVSIKDTQSLLLGTYHILSSSWQDLQRTRDHFLQLDLLRSCPCLNLCNNFENLQAHNFVLQKPRTYLYSLSTGVLHSFINHNLQAFRITMTKSIPPRFNECIQSSSTEDSNTTATRSADNEHSDPFLHYSNDVTRMNHLRGHNPNVGPDTSNNHQQARINTLCFCGCSDCFHTAMIISQRSISTTVIPLVHPANRPGMQIFVKTLTGGPLDEDINMAVRIVLTLSDYTVIELIEA